MTVGPGTAHTTTPLSRPGRGAYPDARKQASGDVDGYLAARRAAETNSSALWRVHHKLYDLEPYLDHHPGGRVWLDRLRGCDCSEAFEAHHLDGGKVRPSSLYHTERIFETEHILVALEEKRGDPPTTRTRGS